MGKIPISIVSLEELIPLIKEAVRIGVSEAINNQSISNGKKLLTPRDVEREFGIHRKMLAYWRMEGIGPTYITFGRRIFYERPILEDFIRSGRIRTTGQVANG